MNLKIFRQDTKRALLLDSLDPNSAVNHYKNNYERTKHICDFWLYPKNWYHSMIKFSYTILDLDIETYALVEICHPMKLVEKFYFTQVKVNL